YFRVRAGARDSFLGTGTKQRRGKSCKASRCQSRRNEVASFHSSMILLLGLGQSALLSDHPSALATEGELQRLCSSCPVGTVRACALPAPPPAVPSSGVP